MYLQLILFVLFFTKVHAQDATSQNNTLTPAIEPYRFFFSDYLKVNEIKFHIIPKIDISDDISFAFQVGEDGATLWYTGFIDTKTATEHCRTDWNKVQRIHIVKNTTITVNYDCSHVFSSISGNQFKQAFNDFTYIHFFLILALCVFALFSGYALASIGYTYGPVLMRRLFKKNHDSNVPFSRLL